MSEVVLAPGAVEAIRRHSEESYPFECCGFLVTRAPSRGNEGSRTVHRIIRAVNSAPTDQRRRYIISPKDLLAVETSLDPDIESVVGFYHSHPDHPAIPSEFDREHAWPWYSYLVQAVAQGHAAELAAFQFMEDASSFERIEWRIDDRLGVGGETVS